MRPFLTHVKSFLDDFLIFFHFFWTNRACNPSKVDYNIRMTITEIKAAMEARGWTIAVFAEKLGVGYNTLRHILAGRVPLTDAMHNHICLLLKEPKEAVLVYRVDINNAKARELLGSNCTVNRADRPAAIEAVIHHNLQELIDLGKKCSWSEDERQFLGLPPAAPAAPAGQPYTPPAQEPFA